MATRAGIVGSGLIAALVFGCARSGEVGPGPGGDVDGGGEDVRSRAFDGPILEVPPFVPPTTSPGRTPPSPVEQPQVPTAAPAVVPPPVSGGTLLILRDGTTAVAADPDRDRIWVADVSRGVLLAEIALNPGDEPGRVAEGAAGRAYVALRRGGAVVAIDAAAGKIVGRRMVCAGPRGLAFDVPRNQLHVACAGGELVTLDANNLDAPGRTLRFERDLRDVVVDGDTLFVSTFRHAEVLVIGSVDGQLRSRMAPPVALNLFRRFNAGPMGPAATRFVPRVAWRTVAKPGGGVLMLHQRDFTGEVAIDPRSGGYGGRTCDALVQTAVTALVPGQANPVATSAIADSSVTVDVAVSPNGLQIAVVSPADTYIAARGSQVTIGTINLFVESHDCLTPRDPALPQGGFGPPSPMTPPAFPEPLTVKWTAPTAGVDRSRIAAEITAVAFSGAGDVVLQSREPPALLVPGRDVKIVFPGTSRADTGHALFHSNTGGDIACASCHPEGGEDGHVWNFAMLGARRTQSLRGGFSATLPLHWDGEMRDLGQIMTEVFSGRMGGPTLTPDQAAAAGRFLDAIPALPAPAPADAAAVERGRQLFSGAAGCSDCHSGARYTNNKTVDVGTGRAFQVPSLTGVGARTPLMHNGCAPTVASRFVADCGGERHGATAALSAAALGDLAAFLETL